MHQTHKYKTLEPDKIIATLAKLQQRIGQRFPNSGLYRVCEELTTMVQATSARAANISRPNLWLRILLTLVALGGAIGRVLHPGAGCWACARRMSSPAPCRAWKPR